MDRTTRKRYEKYFWYPQMSKAHADRAEAAIASDPAGFFTEHMTKSRAKRLDHRNCAKSNP